MPRSSGLRTGCARVAVASVETRLRKPTSSGARAASGPPRANELRAAGRSGAIAHAQESEPMTHSTTRPITSGTGRADPLTPRDGVGRIVRTSRSPAELADFAPNFTIIDVPSFQADPETEGTRTGTAILLNLARMEILIVGTEYAGEIKKSAFTVMNYLMPDEGVLPMHSAANVGGAGDTVVFFGLSGTGKTTLSADPLRSLVGDDEHGWGDDGVFNFEGGCYAKTIRLSPMYEPDIFQTTRRFGTILENVALDPLTRELDLDSDRITENTRGAYPLHFIGNASTTGIATQPKHVVLLTADAFGVLPPISRLTHDQAAYHFISGYTAKLAGTEIGVKEPKATFSTCFGAPFMPRHPGEYAAMLIERLGRADTPVWLVNTGWTGGPYGTGERMNIDHTRSMVRAALNGELDDVPMTIDPIFGVEVPSSCPDVPAEFLQPRSTWQ